MPPKGHWFCLHCDDVVFMPPPPGPTDKAERCQVCKRRLAFFVTDQEAEQSAPLLRKVSPEFAALMFSYMRRVVEKAGAK
jgi:hypothetical protein